MKARNFRSLMIFVSSFILLVFLLLSGCSSKLRVSGEVKFSDGEPLTTGSVIFSNGTRQYQGTINADGSFKLGEIKDGDGIPKGKYRVAIANTSALEYVQKFDQNGQVIDTERIENILIDPIFASFETSGLEYEINNASQKINITIEKPKKK